MPPACQSAEALSEHISIEGLLNGRYMKQKRFWSILLLLPWFVVTAGTIGLSGHATAQSDDAVAQADDVFVARVYYDTIADLEALATYDMWEFNNLQEQYVLVSMDDAIYNELTKAGWRVVIDSEATAQLCSGIGQPHVSTAVIAPSMNCTLTWRLSMQPTPI